MSTTLRLKKGEDRRVRSGHPWIFSNELQDGFQKLEAGTAVRVCDAGGQYVGTGWIHPHSLISVRLFSRDPQTEPDLAFWEAAWTRAYEYREQLGLTKDSFRWIHGEADGFPGLIADWYRVDGGKGSVVVVQAQSFGVDRQVEGWLEKLKAFVEAKDGMSATIILRRDSQKRSREQLEILEPLVLGDHKAADWVSVRSHSKSVALWADFQKGQKTGLFLDQSENISSFIQSLLNSQSLPNKIRILDTFCHSGQWGVKIGSALRAKGIQSRVVFVDGSESALESASQAAKRAELQFEIQRKDLLETELTLDIEPASIDIVVCDPPALVPNRKSLPVGQKAYTKVNAALLKYSKPGSFFVSSSCSQLLSPSDWDLSLQKACAKSGRIVHWSGKGSQAADHPVVLSFPEGEYLKLRWGVVS